MNFSDWAKARVEERMFIIKFIRKYTHLEGLAQLLEEAIHLRSESDIREYGSKNGWTPR